jgi:hypothetical protein
VARRDRPLDGLDEGIRDHIERETQDNVDKGMAPEEARRRALLAFGNVALVREDARAVWVRPWLDALGQDVRYALRMLRRKPGFAAVVVLTLGFGIGVNTPTFSVVNAALIRPLGFAEPERLVALNERLGGADGDPAPFSPPDFIDLERDQQSFQSVAALRFLVHGGDGAVRLPSKPSWGSHFIWGKPRFTPRCWGSGQRLVTTLPRV